LIKKRLRTQRTSFDNISAGTSNDNRQIEANKRFIGSCWGTNLFRVTRFLQIGVAASRQTVPGVLPKWPPWANASQAVGPDEIITSSKLRGMNNYSCLKNVHLPIVLFESDTTGNSLPRCFPARSIARSGPGGNQPPTQSRHFIGFVDFHLASRLEVLQSEPRRANSGHRKHALPPLPFKKLWITKVTTEILT
jgi:hypothetical protein